MNSKMKILIAYDGASCADAALADLPRAGLPSKAEVLVFSVAGMWLLPESPSHEQFVDSAFAEQIAIARKKARAETLRVVEDARTLAVHASETVQALFPPRGMSAWKRVPIPRFGG